MVQSAHCAIKTGLQISAQRQQIRCHSSEGGRNRRTSGQLPFSSLQKVQASDAKRETLLQEETMGSGRGNPHRPLPASLLAHRSMNLLVQLHAHTGTLEHTHTHTHTHMHTVCLSPSLWKYLFFLGIGV